MTRQPLFAPQLGMANGITSRRFALSAIFTLMSACGATPLPASHTTQPAPDNFASFQPTVAATPTAETAALPPNADPNAESHLTFSIPPGEERLKKALDSVNRNCRRKEVNCIITVYRRELETVISVRYGKNLQEDRLKNNIPIINSQPYYIPPDSCGL